MFNAIAGFSVRRLPDLDKPSSPFFAAGGLFWRRDPGPRFAALASAAIATLEADATWEEVGLLAQAAELVITSRSEAIAQEWREGLASGDIERTPHRELLTDPAEVVRQFGGADLLTHTILMAFAGHVPEGYLPTKAGETGDAAAIVSAYALLMLDRAATAIEGGAGRTAMEFVSEGADALRCAAIERAYSQAYDSELKESSAAEKALATARSENASNLARLRWQKEGQPENRARALLLSRSQPFKYRADAVRFILRTFDKEGLPAYNFDTVDGWLKEAGWALGA